MCAAGRSRLSAIFGSEKNVWYVWGSRSLGKRPDGIDSAGEASWSAHESGPFQCGRFQLFTTACSIRCNANSSSSGAEECSSGGIDMHVHRLGPLLAAASIRTADMAHHKQHVHACITPDLSEWSDWQRCMPTCLPAYRTSESWAPDAR